MSQLWWYVARSSGLTAWVLVTASVALGIGLSGRLTPHRGVRRVLLELHPWVSGVALCVLLLHVGAIVADSYVDISVAQAVVPFASPYRTAAVAWGVVGLWLLATVQLTSLGRRHLSRRVWHGIHLLSYAAAALMTLHAVQAGTDASHPLVALSMVAILFALVLATLERVGVRRGVTADVGR